MGEENTRDAYLTYSNDEGIHIVYAGSATDIVVIGDDPGRPSDHHETIHSSPVVSNITNSGTCSFTITADKCELTSPWQVNTLISSDLRKEVESLKEENERLRKLLDSKMDEEWEQLLEEGETK